MRMYNAHMVRASKVRKVPTNLSVRSDLVARAKKLGLNLSQVVEGAIEDAIREAERRAWLDENREAIDDYNAQIAKRGLFSDDWRRF
jgi:antitoxin CcdA